VQHVLELFRDELALALALLGCSSPEALGREHVTRVS
jgi:isopentenyl diphosphate isomerase/L-lactate dehydrogenase-like FMN-dependent dehydrogenase